MDQIVRRDGLSAVSLREAARRAGVTHSAPAHPFGDKAGLPTAFAIEGFRLLRDELAGGSAKMVESPEVAFREVGLAYVEFATRHPAHFAVMFRPEHLNVDDHEYQQAAWKAFQVLLDAVRTVRQDPPPDDPEIPAAATGAWSLTHGFATLWLEGDLPGFAGGKPAKEAAAGAFPALQATLLQAGRPPRRALTAPTGQADLGARPATRGRGQP